MSTNMQNEHLTAYRQTAINTFAVIGFISLLGLGVYGAIYSSRYVPSIVTRLGAAAVYLGSAFTPGEPNELAVVPTASTTPPLVIAFGTSTPATLPVASSTEPAVPKPVITQRPAPQPTLIRVPATTTPALYGLPDLTVKVTAVGYLASNSTDTFVVSAVVPDNERPAVKFTITNSGTNTAELWKFSAVIPTSPSFTYRSTAQQALKPGDSIDYVLGFDRARSGEDRVMTLTVNHDNAITESSKTNNVATVTFDIE